MARSMLWLLVLAAFLKADDKIPEGMLTRQKGELPIILAAPHGGRNAIPGCPERVGKNVPMFAKVTDTNTDLLARKVANAIEDKMKAKPYLVIAHFERRYADVNRSLENGVEHDSAKPYYQAYHDFLKESRDAVQKQWGRGILIDLHGQAAEMGTIFRGTNDLKSTRHLIDRFGLAALTGKHGILGQLEKAGYTITPAGDSKEKEHPMYSGGYTVATYGSKTDGSVDAIQLEIGSKMRTRVGMESFAKDLADAVVVFANEYLPTKKQPQR